MAVTINRDMDQGADFAFEYVVRGTDGSPTDISAGYTAFAQMRRFYSSTTYVDLVASITGSTGTVRVSLGATSTAGVKAGVWYYDLELHSNGSGNVARLVQGMVTVYPEITKIP